MNDSDVTPDAKQQPAQPSAEAVMAASGKTFFQAARLLPENVRSGSSPSTPSVAMWMIWAISQRRVSAVRSQQLQDLQQALLEGQNEEPTGEVLSFLQSVHLSPGGRRAASALVGAAREDLSQKQPKTDRTLFLTPSELLEPSAS